MKKLTTGDMVAGVCSILLVLLAFTKQWASYEIEAFGTSTSEGASILDADAFSVLPKLGILLGFISAIVFIVRAVSGGPSSAPTIYLGVGVVALALLVITIITGPEDISGALENELPGVDLEELGELAGLDIKEGRGIMLYVGALLSAGIAVGGLMAKNATTRTDPAAPVA